MPRLYATCRACSEEFPTTLSIDKAGYDATVDEEEPVTRSAETFRCPNPECRALQTYEWPELRLEADRG